MKSSKFTHRFSGYSIWLEPARESCQAKAIANEMKAIAEMCGGVTNGAHEFAPHCTLLYNFDPEALLQERYSAFCNNNDKPQESECCEIVKQKVARRLLQKCKSTFREKLSNKMAVPTGDKFFLKPSDFYFFPYPVEADDGKGFGCVIPLLLLENSPWLQLLHDIVYDVFPPDERHRKDCVEKESIPNNGKFIPHVALAYVPEAFDSAVNQHVTYLKDGRIDLLDRLPVGCLSLWNTEGNVNHWKLVDSIEL
jgi:hypothetical protein